MHQFFSLPHDTHDYVAIVWLFIELYKRSKCGQSDNGRPHEGQSGMRSYISNSWYTQKGTDQQIDCFYNFLRKNFGGDSVN